MTNILFIVERIYRNQFKWNYLRNQKIFQNFFLHIWNMHQILNIFKKNKSNIAYVFPKL